MKQKEPSLEPFFNQSVDGLCIADHTGHFVKVNPAFSQLLGYSEVELKSRPIFSFIHPEDLELTSEHREKLMDGQPLVNFENRYLSKSGQVVWLYWTSIPVQEEKLIYAIAKDITHIKKLEQERAIHLHRLSRSNERLKRQNYTTSHDLRAPLNNMLSLVHLIDKEKVHDSQTLEILDLIKQSAEGLKNTMTGQLDTYKMEELVGEPLETVDFEVVFKKVLNSISAMILRAGAQCTTDFSALPSVRFKTDYLESIFLNLMTNALKYARPGIPPRIIIRTEVRDGIQTLHFSDNGLGMDMEKIGHNIFKLNERFHDKADSHGVGLYLVHNQITGLGGTIAVESKVNQGTTFTITFAR